MLASPSAGSAFPDKHSLDVGLHTNGMLIGDAAPDESNNTSVGHDNKNKEKSEEQVTNDLSCDAEQQGEDEDEEREDEDEDEDSDEEEEEEEPTLKYDRMGGPINDLLKKDSISALTVANKLVV